MQSHEVLPQPSSPSDDASASEPDARWPLAPGFAIFLSIVRFWPLAILVAIVLIPVAPGIFLLALAGLILAPFYLLARRLIGHGAGGAFSFLTRPRRADRVLATTARQQSLTHHGRLPSNESERR